VLNRIFILIVSVATLGLLQVGGVIPSLSDKALDTLFLLRGPVQPSEDIIIIGVDEESLAELGAWPFPRKYHAELLQQLHQAKAIGFDMLFSEPTIEDERLSAAIAAAPPVVLATAHNYQHRILKPAHSITGYSGLGHIEIILSRDGVVRKSNVFQQSGNSTIPTFSAALLNSTDSEKELITGGEPILINHYGPEITFLYLSFHDVLRGTIPEVFFKDRFVLIGAEALGIGDSHITPFSNEYPTPGVEIQATILNNLLDNSSLKNLRWPTWLLMIVIGLLSIFLWPDQGERWNWIINTSLVTAILFGSFVLFRTYQFFDPVVPLLFLSITFALYLIMERVWTAKKIFNDMRRLDRQLETQLQRVYTNIPSQFFNLHPAPATTGGIKRHLTHLQAGVKVLSLQHHFIENILREELLPLILWDKTSGVVIIANTTFNTFWQNHSAEQSSLPTLDQFTHLLNENQLTKKQNRIDISALPQDNTTIPAIDISVTKQGLKKYFRVSMQLFEITDIKFSGIMATLTDVTEIRELERLKDKIVSVVSHELKLPLTVILGYGEMLADSLQGEKKQYIDEICSQTERLNRLIEDFLDVARIEHNRQEIKRLPLDLIHLIKEAERTVLIPAEKKSISIQSQLPFRATPLIGDYSLLFQAVINLLDNAIKFSPVNTQITLTLTEEVNNFLLSVSDQGPGVPKESQDEIFESFNRGQKDLAENGFGLGLSFVKQVVQKHQGQLWLDHKNDPGACFCLTLPKHFT
jgi:signal transduction histidine kinase